MKKIKNTQENVPAKKINDMEHSATLAPFFP